MYEELKEFQLAFGQRVANKAELPDREERNLRIELLREEFDEYLFGEAKHDIVEIADALADMVYIIYGTAVSYGIPLDEVLKEVHSSNMKKLVDGKVIRREDGKIMKPAGWSPPDIAAILEKHK